MDPGTPPKVGDLIELSNADGTWVEAVITEVTEGHILGQVIGHEVSFSYTINSYRENWRWSQRLPA